MTLPTQPMNEETVIRLELKVCECCGGYWLRKPSDAEVLCLPCRPNFRGCRTSRNNAASSRKEVKA